MRSNLVFDVKYLQSDRNENIVYVNIISYSRLSY